MLSEPLSCNYGISRAECLVEAQGDCSLSFSHLQVLACSPFLDLLEPLAPVITFPTSAFEPWIPYMDPCDDRVYYITQDNLCLYRTLT